MHHTSGVEEIVNQTCQGGLQDGWLELVVHLDQFDAPKHTQ